MKFTLWQPPTGTRRSSGRSHQKLRKRTTRPPSHRQWLSELPEDIYKINPKTKERHEPPCLSLIGTEILNNQMHLTCYFRSWDAFGGLPANVPGLQLFNEAFVAEINERADLNLKTGKLIFHLKNCHIYERQYRTRQRSPNAPN